MATLEDEYARRAHAIQTGIAFELSRGAQHSTPKHLRTGLDCRACDHAALVRLLVKKGVFTDAEYAEEVLAELDRERERREKVIEREYGVKVTLA